MARTLGSGDVDVLGTPAVIAMCEAAAVRAVSAALDERETTVGVRIDLEHTAPTLTGSQVVARARLVGVDGRRLSFDVSASDGNGPIAHGKHVRVLVDRERFLNGARERG
ncbi:MAG: hotdog domain-containing protein [Actinomycetota bacterium]